MRPGHSSNRNNRSFHEVLKNNENKALQIHTGDIFSGGLTLFGGSDPAETEGNKDFLGSPFSEKSILLLFSFLKNLSHITPCCHCELAGKTSNYVVWSLVQFYVNPDCAPFCHAEAGR